MVLTLFVVVGLDGLDELFLKLLGAPQEAGIDEVEEIPEFGQMVLNGVPVRMTFRCACNCMAALDVLVPAFLMV